MTFRSALRPVLPAVAGSAALLLALAACSSSDDDSASDTPSPSASSAAGVSPSASGPAATSAPADVSGTVTVFAAASLKETFTTLGKQFEQAHPGAKVTFNFGGSDTLAASITSGAPADVFAAASAKTMKTVTDAGDAAGTPSTFVRNQLEIATLPGNPDHVATLKDLTKPGLKVALCAKTVPCGSAAQTALTASHLKLTPVTYEQDVKSALTKVELKEVDAAVVYKTDVNTAGGKVDGVDFPESAQAINSYPIVTLKGAPNAAAAQAFIALVQSADGQQVLSAAGFLKP